MADAEHAWLVSQPLEADEPAPFPTSLTVDRLCVSSCNVRTDARDNEATTALERSIAQRGVIMPLVVHPTDQPGVYGVLAGGRRYRSVRNLVARGQLRADYLVPVIVRQAEEAELVETSAAENLIRRDLRDYEVYAAVRRAADAGDDIAAIAEALGQEQLQIQRWLRLGRLAPAIFTTFAEDKLTREQASAYAATEDHDLQAAAFEVLGKLPVYQQTPARIRAELRVGDAQLARLLRFVGEDAYRDAGGGYELDLFADQAEVRGRVMDEDVLQRLASDRLGEVRNAARVRAERKDLRFSPQPPRNDYGTDHSLELHPDDNPAEEPRLLPVDADIFATADVGEDGQARVRWWWASRAAKAGKTKRVPKPPASKIREGSGLERAEPDYARKANAAIREAEGLTETGIQALRSIRRSVLRAMLVTGARELKGQVAIDWLIWSQLRMAMVMRDRPATIGAASIGGITSDPEIVASIIEPLPGQLAWRSALSEVNRAPFMREDDPAKSWRRFRDERRETKELAAAVLAGLALERSLDADGYRLPVHDALANELSQKLEQEVRHWAPPTEALLALIPTKERLAIADPWVERVTYGKWQRLKSTELTRAVFDLLTGNSGAYRTALTKIAASQWVHPLLRFAGAEK